MYEESGTRCSKRPSMPPSATPVIVTMVEEEIRSAIDLAASDVLTTVHTTCLAEAMEAVRQPAARALILSPGSLSDSPASAIRQLVRSGRGITTAAVVSESVAPNRMLELGACGVMRVVDLSEPAHVRYLRAIGRDFCRPTAIRIVKAFDQGLNDACPGSRYFFDRLVALAPTITTVERLAREFGIYATTLISRFHRRSLPSVKVYLAEIRILYAVAYFENPKMSIADVARRLDYSSPQSFGRHVRVRHNMSTTDLRRHHPFDQMMHRFLREFVVPHWRVFASFDPFES